MNKKYFYKYRTPMDLVRSIFPIWRSRDVSVYMVEALVHDNLYEADEVDDEYQKRCCRGKFDGYSDGRKYS